MKKEEILANCIEQVRHGQSTIEECAARYPELKPELTSLLQIAAGLKAEAAEPSPEFKLRAKQYLFEQMQEKPGKAAHSLWFWPARLPARIAVSVLSGLIVLSAAGGSTVYAAQSSLPGDTLYPVKIGVENIQLVVTTDAAAKANLHLELAQRRIDEAKQLVTKNRAVDTQALGTVTQQYDKAIKELSNAGNNKETDKTLSRLAVDSLDQQIELAQVMASVQESSQPAVQQAIDATRRGNTIAQVAYNNQDYLESQPSVADKNLDAGQFKIEGTLLSVDDDNWNVDGTLLENVRYSGDVPAVGSRLKITGVMKDNGFFISSIEITKSVTEPTKVEGRFGGNNQNGTANIGGVPVTIADSGTASLQPGDNVQLKGGRNDGKLNVTGKESQSDKQGNNTTMSGVLTGVDVSGGTVTVQMTGNQITVNIRNAAIITKNSHNRTAAITDLSQMIGSDIKLSGLKKSNGSYSAAQLTVDAE